MNTMSPPISQSSAVSIGLMITIIGAALWLGAMYSDVQHIKQDVAEIKSVLFTKTVANN